MPVVIVLLVLIILAELFLLMLRCRREQRATGPQQ